MTNQSSPKILLKSIRRHTTEHKFDVCLVSKRYKYLTPESGQIINVNQADLSAAKRAGAIIKQVAAKRIIAIGSGKVLDVAKYAASLNNVNLTLAPCVLSTNCFATNKSTLFNERGFKKTFPSQLANTVIIDYKTIKRYDEMNKFGLFDVLATITATADWRLGNQEKNEKLSGKILRGAVKLGKVALDIFVEKKLETKELKKLLSCLLNAGELTRTYGSGRPVSGSEHIFSANIEKNDRCPHGAALIIGTMTSISMQKHLAISSPEGDTFYKKVLQNKKLLQCLRTKFSKNLIIRSLKNAHPRPDRFTVINMLSAKKRALIIDATCNDIFQ